MIVEMFGSFGWPEIIVILIIVLIIFGPGKLPFVGGAIGKGIREFKKAIGGRDDEEDITEEIKPESPEPDEER